MWISIGVKAMDKWLWVLLLCGSAILLSGSFLIYMIIKERKRRRNFGSVWTIGSTKRKVPAALMVFYQKCYIQLIKVPIFKKQILTIRKRLIAVNTYDEFTLRKETIKITLWSLGLAGGSIILLGVLSHSWMAVFFGILAALVLNELIVDIFVNRIEDKLLKQFAQFLEDHRHCYQELKMVDEAVYQAAEASPHEIKMQVERIHEILISHEPEKELESYYAVAPNRYLKVFSGIAHLILEYGDRTVNRGSIYLNSINKLVQEIRYDLMRRQKLRYRLGGMTMIALSPILISFPLVHWAENYFPITKEFYHSKLGFLIRLGIYAISVISYVLIRKLAENDEAKYVPKGPKRQWEKRVYTWRPIKWIIDQIVPALHTSKHYRLNLLLKEANSPLRIEWFYIQRIFVCIAGFITVIVLSLFLHFQAVYNVYHNPTKEQMSILGYMNEAELQKANKLTEFDNKVMGEIKQEGDASWDTISKYVRQHAEAPMADVAHIAAVNRIDGKIIQINGEYFNWYELVFAIALAVIGYYFPLWILQFQRRMRALEMQNEVDQFHVLISILSEFERISVETILEWMERYGIIFKPALQRCLLNFDSGAEEALRSLMVEAPFDSFVRIVRRLGQAVDKITIHEAFDDLEMEREYFSEQKKERLERLIRKKVSWGKLIGWTPGALLIGLYLVFPFLYMSFSQLGQLSIQMQSI